MNRDLPQIDNQLVNTRLPSHIIKVLRAMFPNYRRIVIKSEFGSGLSGSRVFLIRPIQHNGPELPAVIKIDYYERIEREWRAYQQYIRHKLPRVAEIRDAPVYLPGSPWGGLWYPLAGAGAFDIISLRHFLSPKRDIHDVQNILTNSVFKNLHTLWQQKSVQPEFYFRSHYNDFLPVNLVIEISPPPRGEPLRWLHPGATSQTSYQTGEYVQISGFQIVNMQRAKHQITLDVPHDLPGAYRLHVYPIDLTQYEMGEIIHEPLIGKIRTTREAQMRQQATDALGDHIDLASPIITLSDGGALPNPLLTWPESLNQSRDVYVAGIHGDMNLENILVETDSGIAYLIDFAKSRQDHVLRDLLHLEMAVVTEILSQAFSEADLPPENIHAFYERLHCAVQRPNQILPFPDLEEPFAILLTIRQAAAQYLFKQGDWTEYFHGLILYLLGALKFAHLDRLSTAPLPKQLAFWGAAMSTKFLQTSPPCDQYTYTPDPLARRGDPAGTEPRYTVSLPPGGPGGNRIPPNLLADPFFSYQQGLKRLLERIGRQHPLYSEALVYQQRLNESIAYSKRFGDTETRRAERAEILTYLNELALTVLNQSFNQLCQ